MISIPIICFTLQTIMFCGTSTPPEYDTTVLEEVIQDYQRDYLDLDLPEEGSTRAHLVRQKKDGD